MKEAKEAIINGSAVDSMLFDGIDYALYRDTKLKDIASRWMEQTNEKKRERKETLVNVDGYDVKRINMYGLEGEPSVFEREKGEEERQAARQAPPRLQKAGRDYENLDFCLVCHEGGDLLCCDHCAASFHPACIGIDPARLPTGTWTCPQHECRECGKRAHQAGGLIFRCECCPAAFCEDHLPEHSYTDNLRNGDAASATDSGLVIVGESDRYKSLGQRHPKQACFIHCSHECVRANAHVDRIFAMHHLGGIQTVCKPLPSLPPPGARKLPKSSCTIA